MGILDRIKKSWNAFRNITPETENTTYGTVSYFGGNSPSRSPLRIYNERSIISSVYTRLSVDVAGIPIKHVKVDDQDRYISDMNSPLNSCLTLETNIDQAPRAFRQDIALSLFDKGVVAIVPVDTSVNPNKNGTYDVYTMRVGEITAWYPTKVRVDLYNEEKGQREEVLLEKSAVAIVENPLYAVMNEPNSTLQRLIRKLGLLDAVDEQSGSGKLDVIIQVPYVVKSESMRTRAEQRKEDIEFQLRDSKYGIAYVDGTEKITQLNRPAENNLLKQVEYLTNLLYSQLGLTPEVMDGTADEAAMINYFNRTVEPILDAIVEAMQRTFLGSKGATSKEKIRYFRNPFKLVPVAQLAEVSDKFTRNEILTSNEIRSFIGIAPSSDPKADQLINSNMPQAEPTQLLERVRQNGS